MKADIYTQVGKKNGTIDLSESVFGVKWNADLVHQVVVSMQSNLRAGTASVKDRSEVAGGGKKPWKQKGTGRARHGSSRSPIWKGGGVTFGPQNNKDYTKKVNKKMSSKALFATLTRKFKDGEILFLDNVNFEAPKTSEAKTILANLAKIDGFDALTTKKHNTLLLALATPDTNTKKSFANFGNVEVKEARNLNPVDVLKYKYVAIVTPEEAQKQLEARIK